MDPSRMLLLERGPEQPTEFSVSFAGVGRRCVRSEAPWLFSLEEVFHGLVFVAAGAFVESGSGSFRRCGSQAIAPRKRPAGRQADAAKIHGGRRGARIAPGAELAAGNGLFGPQGISSRYEQPERLFAGSGGCGLWIQQRQLQRREG